MDNLVNNKNNYIKGFLNPSTILGIISAIFILIGLLAPAIDFSHFHDQVDIQYNFIKISQNVGIISSVWIGIPYGIIIGIIIMAVLSFVRIPLLKIIPCILIIAMFILMLTDLTNVIDWINGVLSKYQMNDMISVDISQIIKSMMAGIYFMVIGLISGIVSCFVKA